MPVEENRNLDTELLRRLLRDPNIIEIRINNIFFADRLPSYMKKLMEDIGESDGNKEGLVNKLHKSLREMEDSHPHKSGLLDIFMDNYPEYDTRRTVVFYPRVF